MSDTWTWFHGSTHEITRFTVDHVGSRNEPPQNGPGIYFTSCRRDAKTYGHNIHKVLLKKTNKDFGDDYRKPLPADLARDLIKHAPDESRDYGLEDWAESPDLAYPKAIAAYSKKGVPAHLSACHIFNDFYGGDVPAFLDCMRVFGWDYVVLHPNPSVPVVQHLILFNPRLILHIDLLTGEEDD